MERSQKSSTPNSTEHMRLLLMMIEDTHRMQLMSHTYANWAKMNPAPFLDFGMIAERSQLEVRANAKAINESLIAIGGIRHFFTDTATRARIDCVLEEWHGTDPTQSANHLWRVRELPGQTVSFTPDLLDELHATL